MKLLLMAHDIVGLKITQWLIDNYKEDIGLVVIKDYMPIALSGEKVPWTGEAPKDGDFDLGITAWWPDIIKEPLLSLPKHGWINTHPSYLPYCRGKHSSFWAIVEQVPYGVSLHKIGEGIDDGPIVAQKEIPYTWEDTGETLYLKAHREMVNLFIETYPKIRTLDFEVIPQGTTGWDIHGNPEIGNYHQSSEIERAKGVLLRLMDITPKELLNKLRAGTFTGRPACWFEEDGIKYEVRVDIRRIK